MLSTIGLNHKTAPLLVREQLSFAEAELPRALRALRGVPDVREAFLISTCNRTEVYLLTPDRPPVALVSQTLAALRGVPAEVFAPFLTVRLGEDAAYHLLRVAAGLEAMMVGERQILGQVRRAFAAARESGTTGPVLHRLLQLAIASGRRVRAETGLGRRNASVPHAAFALCRSRWGSAAGHAVAILGAGEMGALVAKAFHEGHAQVRVVANRTPDAAHVLATRYGAQAVPLDGLRSVLAGVDALIVSVGADRPILDERVFAGMARAHPLLVIDIGVPRGVDPAAGRLPGVTLYDLDALVPAGQQPEHPAEDLAAAEAIVEESLEAFLRWHATRAAVPLIAALHRRAEAIVDEELMRARGRLQGLDERQRRAVRGVVEGALRKLLHAPFVRLRARADDDRALALARELFDLDGGGETR